MMIMTGGRSNITKAVNRNDLGAVIVVSLCCLIGAAVVQGHSISSSNETGRSLVIVFDTTWSMDDDLQELRSGAAHIVKEMMRKETSPIYNYVFVPFNDPCE